ncbi:hypothetical protein B0H66DRAFT_585538 [Apodospora peruviana]|uniref:FR47-like domain-containing protein n=1 Tax=Apodospora peruviana TaxID=516989 RepID=A0AAE0MFC2_9PEZI|nr:hypothetical protein B0H66DRAFT_585538 [Apodospora peruviana]
MASSSPTTTRDSKKIIIHDFGQTPTKSLLTDLEGHLPFSLPVLRRIQFALNFPGGCTANTHILHACYDDERGHFVAAYVDVSRFPETQCWFYCTLEDLDYQIGVEEEGCDEFILAVLKTIKSFDFTGGEKQEKAVDEKNEEKRGQVDEGKRIQDAWQRGEECVLIGSLHEAVRQRMLRKGIKMSKTLNVEDELEWEFCGKWLFREEDLSKVSSSDGVIVGRNGMTMRWDKVRREDVALILSRTSIKRQEATLLLLPSTVIRLEDGTPVAWGFMGLDGTLMTLHVEEPYRGQGLAKAVASKLMRDHIKDYGDDGWGVADVFVSNYQSQGVCKSIGGKLCWTLSCRGLSRPLMKRADQNMFVNRAIVDLSSLAD